MPISDFSPPIASDEQLSWQRKRLQRILDFGGVVIIVFASIFAALIFWRVDRLVRSLRLVDRTDQVVKELHIVQEDLLDLETGQRGYSLSQRSAFLQPYRLAHQRIGRDFHVLLNHLGTDPAQEGRARDLYAQYLRWDDFTRTSLLPGPPAPPSRAIRSLQTGKILMDGMRERVQDMISAEESRWPARLSSSIWLTRGLFGTVLLSALAVGALAALYSRRHTLSLLKAYDDRAVALRERDRLTLFLETVLAQMPSGVLIMQSSDGKVLFANPQIERILGQHDQILRPYDAYRQYHYCHPGGRPFEDSEYPLARALRGEFVHAFEAEVCRADQATSQIEISAAPVRNEQGRIVAAVGLITDIRERINAQAELRQLLERERKAAAGMKEEKALRERFVQMLSHDLRNPLAGARAVAELVERGLAPEERGRALLRKQLSILTRMDRMIQSLLDDSRILEGGKLHLASEHCDLIPILREVIEELGRSFGNRFVLDTSEASLPGVWDAGALRRVLENLCSNAAKYGASDRPITVVASGTPEQVQLRVHNSGNPIPLTEQAGLFSPFKRSAAAQQSGNLGWGLGLAYVKLAVEAHQGTVSLESSEEAGTTFIVSLPRDARASRAAA